LRVVYLLLSRKSSRRERDRVRVLSSSKKGEWLSPLHEQM
jgi:hypothetical protein